MTGGDFDMTPGFIALFVFGIGAGVVLCGAAWLLWSHVSIGIH